MSATMEIVVSAQDQASGVIEGIADTVEDAGSDMELTWATVAAASVVAGAATEGFARSQADTNATLGRMALRTGESESALRDLIDGMVDHTFSAHDAAAGMEALSKRGVENREDFEKLLPVYDTFADATGKDMVQGIEEVTRVLGALGIPATESADHIDTLTHLSENLDVELGFLGKQLGNNADELDALGLSLDGSAAGIQALVDRGLSGRDATKKFAEAVRESDGDMDALLTSLGLTADEFAGYQEKIGEASGLTEEFAEINNATMTPLEEMQANLVNLMAKYGGLADAAGMAAPVLIAVGPIMKGVTLASDGLSKALTFLAANPIVLVIAVVAALAAGLVIAYQKSETFRRIVDGVFRAVGRAGTWLWESAIKPAFDGIKAGFDFIMRGAEAFGRLWSKIMSGAGKAVDLWTAPYRAAGNLVGRGLESVVNGAANAINRIPSINIPSWVPGIGGRSFSIPTIPTISIPRLHDGGVFRAPGGSGEGLALLRDREVVTTPEQASAAARSQDRIERLLEELIAAVRDGMRIDGRRVAAAVGPALVDVATSRGVRPR